MKSLFVSGALLGLLAGCSAVDDEPSSVDTREGEGGCPPGSTASSGGNGGGGGTTASTTASTTAASGSGGAGGSAEGGGGGGAPEPEPQPTILDKRKLDYNEALRTASLKLVGTLPTFQQVEELRTAPPQNQKAMYEQYVDDMMNDVRFKRRLVDFWRNEFRMGGNALRDTAPTFAAQVTFEGRSFAELFTATSDTCPTFDGTNFINGTCTNANPTVGLLTNPGVQSHYYGNLAFRRLRFFQEVFACRKYPAEYAPTPIPMGAGDYTAPWPFDSIAGTANGGRMDFLDTSSAICANCHATMNHRAPLFAYFDQNGVQQTTIKVNIPITGTPIAEFSDWLPPGQVTAFKLGKDAPDLTTYGQHMSADEGIQYCAVARVWNFAMSRGDIVNDAADVPSVVIQPLLDAYKQSNFNLRNTFRSAFTHDDFVRF